MLSLYDLEMFSDVPKAISLCVSSADHYLITYSHCIVYKLYSNGPNTRPCKNPTK